MGIVMAKCECNALMEGECACGAWSGERDYYDDEEFEYGVRQPIDWAGGTLGANLESAAGYALMHRIGYTRGFEAGRLLAEFCEDYVPEPYMPMGDTRPTAERLGWR